MTTTKQLWLLAGGNGAGKSTFYELFLKPKGILFVNADRIARLMAPEAPEASSYDAAQVAARMREDLVAQGTSFCFETVFSHASKIDFVAHAKSHGYEVVFVFVHVASPQLNLARVAQRVAAGGHDVPEEKVIARVHRSLTNARKTLPLTDLALLFDNSSSDDPFVHVATCKAGCVEFLQDEAPEWALSMLADYLQIGRAHV